jgi:ArsR family transcriptional regulator
MAIETETVQQAVPCCEVDHAALAALETPVAETAAVIKALSDETRLRIVRTIARSGHELCECNIVPLFGLSQSTISYHLKVLRQAGILEAEKRGLWAYYRVNPRALMGAVKTLAELV